MVLGVFVLVVPLILNITESSIRMFVPMAGLLLLLFGFPIMLGSKKDKNTET
jgi:small neutral amino acid transporter SnatA (MarC family)